jgi:four helix bundle protein
LPVYSYQVRIKVKSEKTMEKNNKYVAYVDLEVWKNSRALVSSIYRITKKFPTDELYGLTTQMRRSAISIPSNIAEGCGRNHKKDTIQFLYISRGSLYELETQLYISFDLGYISQEILDTKVMEIRECRKLLSGFIRYYESKNAINQN